MKLFTKLRRFERLLKNVTLRFYRGAFSGPVPRLARARDVSPGAYVIDLPPRATVRDRPTSAFVRDGEP